MPVPSDPETFRALFIERTHHLPLVIGDSDASSGSRIGGRAPAEIENPGIGRSGGPLTYFLTIGADILGTLVDPGMELSFFYVRDERERLGGTPGEEGDVMTVLMHPISTRAGSARDIDSPLEGRALMLGALTEDRAPMDAPATDSKIGGTPGLIQDEPFYLEHVESRSLEFLLQISEETFPAEIVSRYIFYYGAVYIYTRIDQENRRIEAAEVGSFWQH